MCANVCKHAYVYNILNQMDRRFCFLLLREVSMKQTAKARKRRDQLFEIGTEQHTNTTTHTDGTTHDKTHQAPESGLRDTSLRGSLACCEIY